jgi:hypothetical protein
LIATSVDGGSIPEISVDNPGDHGSNRSVAPAIAAHERGTVWVIAAGTAHPKITE